MPSPIAPLDGHTLDAMRWLYGEAAANPDSYPWLANWQIILTEEGVPVGSACFKGGPDGEGSVEIGSGSELNL